ncbi:MAG: EAL domain-containing protein [Luteimonas sp.]
MKQRAVISLDYGSIFSVSSNACLILAPDLTILDANKAIAALARTPRKQLIGQQFFKALPARLEDGARILRASFKRVLELGKLDTISFLHYPVAMPDGSTGWQDRYWRVQNTPLRDVAGRIVAILHCPTDVTSMEVAAGGGDSINRELVHGQRRFRQLMQQSPGFLAVGYGPDHVFELANNAYYQLVGHRDILGKPVRQALPELANQGFSELLDHVYATGEPYIGHAVPILLQRTPDAPLVERYVDFIYQPIREDDGRVSGIFVQGHDVTDAHELSRRISHQASHDVLTGLMNRREFERQLGAAVENLQDHPGIASLLYLDLDQFKVVNDTCGHAAGDELLRQIAALLGSHVPAAHALARLGGDEFAILLKDTGPEQALAFAEGLRAAIDGTEYVSGRRKFGCAASLGVISFGPEIASPAQALSLADAACFLAKEKGRNQVKVHQLDDVEIAAQRREMDWVSRLRDALAEQRMVLYAQRIESLASTPDPMLRLEVLVRLRDTDGTLVPPMAFIPAAERYGDMPALDRFVIRGALEFLQTLPEDKLALTQLYVNLSGTTVNGGRLLAYIRETFEHCPHCAPQICFELTETAALQNLTLTAKLMVDLKELGFKFALDDFGSGMSSLTYLKHLPVDFIKIDGVFIRDVVSDSVDAAIVEAIAGVAKVIGIKTVAEYVETSDSRALLARLGINYVQGFGVHVPEPLADAAKSVMETTAP